MILTSWLLKMPLIDMLLLILGASIFSAFTSIGGGGGGNNPCPYREKLLHFKAFVLPVKIDN